MMIEAALIARDTLAHGGNGVRNPLPAHRAVVEAISAGDVDGAERARRTWPPQAAEDVDLVRRRGTEDG